MKARVDAIIQREQAEYLDRLSTQRDSLLAEMEEYAAEHRVPIADREVAMFLEITAPTTRAQSALEIGMAIGYSVIHLLRGMDYSSSGGDGAQNRTVTTIELSDDMIDRATGFLKRANLFARVQRSEERRVGKE